MLQYWNRIGAPKAYASAGDRRARPARPPRPHQREHPRERQGRVRHRVEPGRPGIGHGRVDQLARIEDGGRRVAQQRHPGVLARRPRAAIGRRSTRPGPAGRADSRSGPRRGSRTARRRTGPGDRRTGAGPGRTPGRSGPRVRRIAEGPPAGPGSDDGWNGWRRAPDLDRPVSSYHLSPPARLRGVPTGPGDTPARAIAGRMQPVGPRRGPLGSGAAGPRARAETPARCRSNPRPMPRSRP